LPAILLHGAFAGVISRQRDRQIAELAHQVFQIAGSRSDILMYVEKI